MRGSKVAGRAVAFIRAAQNRDGGFGQYRGGSSNAQSTSWAVQGLVAVKRKPSGFKRHGHTPLTYLRSLQQKDGSIRYSRTSAQTRVWVTAQAPAALAQKAFPLKAAPRAAAVRTGRASPGAGGGGGGAAAPPTAKKKKQQHAKAHRRAAPKTSSPGQASSPTTTPTTPAEQGQAPQSAPKDAPASDRAALELISGMNHGNEGAAWAGGALVAGVAALVLGRLARRRGRREGTPQV